MTTNQTIDGVPREQVERALDAIEQAGLQDKFIDYTFVRTVKHELRALLDARESCGACNGCTNGCRLDAESTPASKPQGEPVAHTMKTVMQAYENAQALHLPGTSNFCAVMAKHLNKYADQPAPVAVVLPKRRAVSPARDQAMCANSWNACLDELKLLNPSL